MSLSDDAFDKLEKELEIESSFKKAFVNSFKFDKIKCKQKIKLIICFTIFTILSYPIALSNNTIYFISDLTNIGINFSIGIIGFLIAGFALYAGTLERKNRYILILTKAKDKKINMYKSNMLIFFKPFGIFLLILTISIFTKFAVKICSSQMIIKYINILAYHNILISIFISMLLNIILIGIITLKIFIYNIYSSMMSIGKDELYYENMNISEYIEYLEKHKNSDLEDQKDSKKQKN